MARVGVIAAASQIGACQPKAKLKSDTIAAKIFYRRAGYFVAAVLWRVLGLKPNGISLLGGALAMLTIFVAMLYPSIWLVSFLLIAIGLFDCADGALARYLQQANPRGELADAIGGYMVLWCIPFITWMMAFPPAERLGDDGLLVGLISAVVVAFHYLGRSIQQKMALVKDASGTNSPKQRTGLVKRIQGDLSFCGFMFPVFIASWFLDCPIAGWLYAVIFLSLVGLVGLLSGARYAAL